MFHKIESIGIMAPLKHQCLTLNESNCTVKPMARWKNQYWYEDLIMSYFAEVVSICLIYMSFSTVMAEWLLKVTCFICEIWSPLPGSRLIISGTSFSSTFGTVYIGSVQASVVSWTDSQIEVDVALISAGIHDVFVTTINGRATDGLVNTFCFKLPFSP